MKEIYTNYLFNKGYLIGNHEEENSFETILALAIKFGISVKKGHNLANIDVLKVCAQCLGEYIPESFYRGFPQSVKKLNKMELLFDKLLHYCQTYGLGNFDEAGHSIFEEEIKRTVLKERTDIKYFEIITEAEAERELFEIFDNLLASTRPLSVDNIALICSAIEDYVSKGKYIIKNIASKETAIIILISTKNLYYAKFIGLKDVLKVAEKIGESFYKKNNKRKTLYFNIPDQEDKAFINKLVNELSLNVNSRLELQDNLERKKSWCGLLHHVNFRAENAHATFFASIIRSKVKAIRTIPSIMNTYLKSQDKQGAVSTALKKGTSYLLRNLLYVLSHFEKQEDIEYILNNLEGANNPIVLIQMINFLETSSNTSRTFTFTKNNKTKKHIETEEEFEDSARSKLTTEQKLNYSQILRKLLHKIYSNKLGKVYIDPSFEKIALPIEETTSSSGYGVLPKGSRVPLNGKNVRAFTYWEKVNDIDLSSMLLFENGKTEEISWRSWGYSSINNKIFTFSGDQTSGYHGGVEYLDFDITQVKKYYPTLKYIIFSDNVYSGVDFSEVYCKAGFMLRKDLNAGKAFEPKTVATSFTINAPTTFVYLFAIDIEKEEMIWLNTSNDKRLIVAGNDNYTFLKKYFDTTRRFNVKSFFEMLATEIVATPEEADFIISDKIDNANIRSCDIDKMLKLVNNK